MKFLFVNTTLSARSRTFEKENQTFQTVVGMSGQLKLHFHKQNKYFFLMASLAEKAFWDSYLIRAGSKLITKIIKIIHNYEVI